MRLTPHDHVQRMIDQIQRDYTAPLTLNTFARTLGRQAAYLGRVFRDEVGVTVHDYLTRMRVQQGAAQVNSGEKIEAVALCVGYRSKKNFYRQFKRYFGCTPEEYRRHGGDDGVPQVEESSTQPRASNRQRRFKKRARPLRRAFDRARHRTERLTILAQRIALQEVAGSRIAVLITDDLGRYVGANRVAMSLTGYSIAELRELSMAELFATRHVTDNRRMLQILIPEARLLPANAVLKTKSRGAIDVHLITARNPYEPSES